MKLPEDFWLRVIGFALICMGATILALAMVALVAHALNLWG